MPTHHLSQSWRLKGLLRIWHLELPICDMQLLFPPFDDLAHFFTLTFIAFSLHHWLHSIRSMVVSSYRHLNPLIRQNSNHLTCIDKLLGSSQDQALLASISTVDLTIQSDGCWFTRSTNLIGDPPLLIKAHLIQWLTTISSEALSQGFPALTEPIRNINLWSINVLV